jgi:hypothetical protein
MEKIGDKGSQVIKLQRILADQGYSPGPIDGDFGRKTFEALQEFQGGHLGPDKRPLDSDGIAGPATWWALEHPFGDSQRHFYVSKIPDGIEGSRRQVLEAAEKEHAKGVKEIPDGSNWGPEIQKYGGRKGWAWCCLFFSWITKVALGFYVMGGNLARCFAVYERAKDRGWWRDKADYSPVPGDVGIMLYRDDRGRFNGKGHIFFVLAVDEDGKSFNTIEGNCGNRVKLGLRYKSQKTLAGFVNFYQSEEQPKTWERGLVKAKAVAGDGTR